MEDASQAVAEEYRGTTFGVLWAYVRAGGPMVVALLAPLIIASDVAQVSSMCDRYIASCAATHQIELISTPIFDRF
eukprot:SAG31_NODE_1342_length_8700_cov_12.667829_2_plen_76_part_00